MTGFTVFSDMKPVVPGIGLVGMEPLPSNYALEVYSIMKSQDPVTGQKMSRVARNIVSNLVIVLYYIQ